MKAIIQVENLELSFSDSHIVNPGDYIPHGEYNPHNVRPWLLHDHGFPLAVVFADCLQNAVDIAVDHGKLASYLIDEADYGDYGVESDCPACAFLGNACELFDIDTLGYVELRNPPFSFAAIWQAQFSEGGGTVSAHFA